MLAVYEATLELDRFVDTEDDNDAILNKMDETVEARKQKLDALVRIEKEIGELSGAAAEHAENDLESSKNTVVAVLHNIEALDAKIREKIRRLQDSISGEIRATRDSQKCFQSYVAHEPMDAAQGLHLNTLK